MKFAEAILAGGAVFTLDPVVAIPAESRRFAEIAQLQELFEKDSNCEGGR